MKVKVKVTQYDFLEKKEHVLTEGNAILDKNQLKYKENKENAFHFVTFSTEHVNLERKSDISSITVLNNGKWGHSTVKSPYGDMEMKTKTYNISMKEREWSVEYSVFSGKEEVLHQKLLWVMEYYS